MTMPNPIDVWNVATFDAELQHALAENEELIRSYILAESAIEAEYQSSDHLHMRRSNDFASSFGGFQEALSVSLTDRSIRGWHYTRLTDAEVESIRRHGIELSTLRSLRRRLDAQIAAGNLVSSQAEAIYNSSPFNGSQHDARTGKFWMTSHPLPISYSGVIPLLASWGGEAAYFWQQDSGLMELLKKIGAPRLIEVAVPLSSTRRAYLASAAIVSTFGRTLGCYPEKCTFDLYSEAPLPPASILKLHSEGDEAFAKIAEGYPEDFVDAEIGRWDHV
jgi:hypothetical protein